MRFRRAGRGPQSVLRWGVRFVSDRSLRPFPHDVLMRRAACLHLSRRIFFPGSRRCLLPGHGQGDRGVGRFCCGVKPWPRRLLRQGNGTAPRGVVGRSNESGGGASLPSYQSRYPRGAGSVSRAGRIRNWEFFGQRENRYCLRGSDANCHCCGSVGVFGSFRCRRHDVDDAIAARPSTHAGFSAARRQCAPWISCKSRMPLPLASSRFIARSYNPRLRKI